MFQYVKVGSVNSVYYKTTEDVTFKSDILKSFEKIGELSYELKVEPRTIGSEIISVFDSDGNLIDEIIVKCIVILPEEQYIYIQNKRRTKWQS